MTLPKGVYFQENFDSLTLRPFVSGTESNGDGTAKVQSDDIVKSSTIGKVTIGNSSTGVKLVSCVLYCG